MRFLSIAEVIEMHAAQLKRFDGGSGLRSHELLASAVAQPEATFGGEYLHADVFEMAAAYFYHLVQNHPFVDGNKRIGLLCALVFLDLNGHTISVADARLYEMTMAIACGDMKKEAVAKSLREIANSP